MRKYRKYLYLILLVFWMSLIYGFSNQQGEQSGGLSLKICHFLFDTFYKKYYVLDASIQESILHVVHFCVRKLAHMTEYGILFILSYLFLFECGFTNKKVLIICLLFCFIYANIDEYHQSFIQGRSGNFKDVLIDTSGSSIALCFILLFNKIFKRKSSV